MSANVSNPPPTNATTNPLPPKPTSPKTISSPSKAAQPTRRFFDPWNSSSTGHQRAENRLAGSTSWRDSRSLKLGAQFKAGAGGGARVADTVGAGSEDFGKDGRLESGGWVRGAKGLREDGQLSIWEGFSGIVGVKKGSVDRTALKDSNEDVVVVKEGEEDMPPTAEKKQPQVFANLTVYINGSTSPQISDHKLKHLLVSHGANLSIALGRRTVTHVILGRPNGSASHPGAGGGLAASKIQKEIARVGGKNVKFVTVEWVLESVRLGKRAQESRFEAVRLAPKGTARVGDMFAKAAGVKKG